MRARVFLGLCVLLSLGALPYAAAKNPDAASLFQEANTSYRAGEYARAATLYEKLIGQGEKDAALHYNLGNAYYKESRIGLALLQYEKGRKIAPRDRDLLANLNYVRGLLEYRVEDKRNWYLRAIESALTFFTEEELGIVSLTLSLLFWVGWIIALYLKPEASWGWKRKTVLVFASLALSIWLMKGIHDLTSQEAIVLKPQGTVRYGPSYKDQVALRLGEGIKVRVTKREGEWSRILLVNGETGWTAQEEMGVI